MFVSIGLTILAVALLACCSIALYTTPTDQHHQEGAVVMTHPFRNDDDAVFEAMFPEDAQREREKTSPTTAADDDPLTADILRQSHPGYGAMRDRAQAEQRQTQRNEAPLTAEQIADARVADSLGIKISAKEREAVDEANARDHHAQQLADDRRAIESQRERLADQSDRVREMQATLAEIERTVGRFDVGNS